MEINRAANKNVSGFLHVVADGYGFLRPTVDASASVDDIYVSPSQIRRFDLKSGAHLIGLARPPRQEGQMAEIYDVLLKIEQIDHSPASDSIFI